MICSARELGSDETGSVIVAVLLILVTLTVIGIWAMNTTILEYQIATNDQLHKIAFTNADSGVFATPKLISKAINESAPQDGTVMGWFGFSFLNGADENHIYRQIMEFDPYDGGTADIGMADTVYNDTISIDIQRLSTEHVKGGGVEFASGAEGIGVGSTGGIEIYYGEDSFGPAPRQSVANVLGTYRKVPKIPGGL
jgi:hypothetical protein